MLFSSASVLTAFVALCASTATAHAHGKPQRIQHAKRMVDLCGGDGVVNVEYVRAFSRCPSLHARPGALGNSTRKGIMAPGNAVSRWVQDTGWGRAETTSARDVAKSHTLSQEAYELWSSFANLSCDHSFLSNDFKRASHKYTKANSNFKANHVNSALARRQADVFTRAQELERRSRAMKRDGSKRADARHKRNKVAKRASSGAIDLTDYFSGGQDAAYYGPIGIGTPAQTFGELRAITRTLWRPSLTNQRLPRHLLLARCHF